ncbi:DUF4440 domain-containing protein [Mycobacterium sp. CBMA271]|uniref:YybH family protein n=1 Tax=unclassified Mycobacteroides TaxID=2618759 RepID=UPI0012DC926C|nr:MULTISPECIES: nuclear transport factor 2 family protein [unclassified Mycobacteroides]MUM18900.1 hypothetical protein [Mycobacteroides sp. CBMA 326]MUM23160.1 DUF4440 domain-containing protein [Mycobacteroides sp. CBMA 271]
MSAEAKIRERLTSYFQALNEDDVDAAVASYTSDGVFMPSTLPTSVGPELSTAYKQTFEAIHLNVSFAIDELRLVGETDAYVLTQSHGTVRVNGTAEEHPEFNRELFILRVEDDEWKIARYMFNKSS